MKKHELAELVVNNIGKARSINNLIEILNIKGGGGYFKTIKQIICDQNLNTSHFGGKILRKSKYKKVEKKCIVCDNTFITKEGHKKEQKYCSKSCSNNDRLLSNETKEKISNTLRKTLNVYEKYEKDIIELAKRLREAGECYTEILNQTRITENDLKKIFRDLHLNKAPSVSRAQKIDGNECIKLYLKHKNLKKVASILHTSVRTVRKYISDDMIIIKPKIISKSKSVVGWRKRSKIKLVEHKGGKCEICNYDKSIAALQFHHKNPEEKDFTIGGRSYAFERLKEEVDKCILVCANCHCEIHEEIRQYGYSEKINKITCAM